MGLFSVLSTIITTLSSIPTLFRIGYTASLVYFGPAIMVTTMGLPGFIGLSAITYGSSIL